MKLWINKIKRNKSIYIILIVFYDDYIRKRKRNEWKRKEKEMNELEKNKKRKRNEWKRKEKEKNELEKNKKRKRNEKEGS